ncbi:MAG: hypothetical protein KIT81_02140 [Alphaproteobacteria bacterium]|nr:hypothetical protein [Alphaproteobacteria bacterium]
MKSRSPKPELFDEMNALVKAIAGALRMEEADVVNAFENNMVVVNFKRTVDGKPVIDVRIAGKRATIALGESEA